MNENYKSAPFSRTVGFIGTIKIIFFLSSLFLVEDKSSLSETMAKCRPQRVIPSSFANYLQSSGRRRRGDTSKIILRKSFHPFAPLEVTLAFSDQDLEYKTILSPFTRPTQYWLPSEVKVKMSQSSSIGSFRHSVQFAFLRIFFTICNVLYNHTTYSTLDFCCQMIDELSLAFAE